jgi:hypothetical protein
MLSGGELFVIPLHRPRSLPDNLMNYREAFVKFRVERRLSQPMSLGLAYQLPKLSRKSEHRGMASKLDGRPHQGGM